VLISLVRLPGLEPRITDPKSVVISISLQAQTRGKRESLRLSLFFRVQRLADYRQAQTGF
jgi:hypothetical protein